MSTDNQVYAKGTQILLEQMRSKGFLSSGIMSITVELEQEITDTVAEQYNENHLYTIASSLSRFVEDKVTGDTITYQISKALRQLYHNELCNSSVEQMLMIQAWRLLLILEFIKMTDEKEMIDLLVETQIKPFVDGLDRLGIYNLIKTHLNSQT